jgi:very-short-patch-repair endonuclease
LRSKRLAQLHRRADARLGLITTAELLSTGFSRSAISRLVDQALIVPVHRAVYRVPGSVPTIQQRALAATLACGKGAVVSGVTAAELWKLIEQGSARSIHVTVERIRRVEHPGVIVHRAIDLPKSDVTFLGPIPITRVERTLRDLPRASQEEAFDEAIRQRRIAPPEFLGDRGYLGRLAKDRLGLGVPQERIERKAVALFKKLKLPPPKRQHWIEVDGRRYRLDLAYPERRIAIELLGEAAHWGRVRFQSDIDRRNALETDGWRQIDFSWFDITRDERKVERVLRSVLAD